MTKKEFELILHLHNKFNLLFNKKLQQYSPTNPYYISYPLHKKLRKPFKVKIEFNCYIDKDLFFKSYQQCIDYLYENKLL